ncbi:hypothetical protein AA0X95_16515 [Bacillus sp. 1P10SD]|uniref:hypothetical protein n=1 Tax=Bacillus sp. 1P10SD TaxID=3132265 RepID=UPI0039A4C38E
MGILLEDIKGIYSNYEYGFTRFNFEHSMIKDISSLLKMYESPSNKNLLLYDEVKFKLDDLFKFYKLDIEKDELKRKIELLEENRKKLEVFWKLADNEYNLALNQLKTELTEKSKELNIYSNKIPKK